MRKIYAALLAALLLASIPVHAVGWEPEAPEATPPCTVGISLYEYSQTVELGGGYYKPFSGEAQKGTMLRALVSVHIPAGVDVSRLDLKISATGFEVTEIPALTLVVGRNDFLLAGYLTQSAATIKAELIYKGLTVEELPRVSVTEGGVLTVDRLGFVVDAKDKITGLLFDGEPLGRTLSGDLDLSEAERRELNETLSYLGFKLDGSLGYMSRELIEKHLGGAWAISATARLGATSITGPVSGPAAAIPQTGAASCAPALFIIPAAALAVAGKKRRR